MKPRTPARTVALALAASGVLTATSSGTAISRPTAREAAMVSMGDSYISGEGGRWRGNSEDNEAQKRGTDRAYVCESRTSSAARSSSSPAPSATNTPPPEPKCTKDPKRVYGTDTYAYPCHRSDVAEVESAKKEAKLDLKPVNIACSGAETKHLLEKTFKDQVPQVKKLETELKARYDVKLIVLSVGGNDLGFGTLIRNCYIAWWFGRTCETTKAAMEGKVENVGKEIKKVITKIQDVMKGEQYKLVLQSYPAAIAPTSRNRAKTKTAQRSQGCQIKQGDADWAIGLGNKIAEMQHRIARETKVSFMDIKNAFQGNEVCADTARQAQQGESIKKQISEVSAEWMRYLIPFSSADKKQESLHPNSIGQNALGYCLKLMYGKVKDSGDPVSYECLRGGPQKLRPSDMRLVGLNRPPRSAGAHRMTVPRDHTLT
ncbi:GDSL-type esterase/lipase family protein [Streptomyces chrestomyceticus]|uniref:GDSL-type esterase/lipase family protein n=1 Tax=Streptomyces chrestomyceticus TaxID=68185 RepID=UPI0033F9D267